MRSTFTNNAAAAVADTYPAVKIKRGKKGGSLIALFTSANSAVVLATDSQKWKDHDGNRLNVGSVLTRPSTDYVPFDGSVIIEASAGNCG